MNDTLGNVVQTIEGGAQDAACAGGGGLVTRTLKVLSEVRRQDGREVRTVLFLRSSGGGTIAIRAEIDTPNLLAGMEALGALVERMLAGEEAVPVRGVLRLIGVAYRALSADGVVKVARAPVRRGRGKEPGSRRARGRGAVPRRRGAR